MGASIQPKQKSSDEAEVVQRTMPAESQSSNLAGQRKKTGPSGNDTKPNKERLKVKKKKAASRGQSVIGSHVLEVEYAPAFRDNAVSTASCTAGEKEGNHCSSHPQVKPKKKRLSEGERRRRSLCLWLRSPE